MFSVNVVIACVGILALFYVATVTCGDFNLSVNVDKDELWDALLRRKLTPKLFHSTKLLDDNNYDNNSSTNNNKNNISDEFDDDNDAINTNASNSSDELPGKNSDTIDNADDSFESEQVNKINQNVSETKTVLNKNDDTDVVITSTGVKDVVTVGDNRKTEQHHLHNNSNENSSKNKNNSSKTVSGDNGNIESSDLFLKNIDVSKIHDLHKANDSSQSSKNFNYKRNSGFKRSRPKPGQTSLVIVFDGTGSMENCLKQLRSGAQMIIDKFINNDDNPIYNYIFVPFRDPESGPATVTTDVQELLDTLNNLKLYGGGDCPESTLGGISMALKYALPKSYVYVFTDAIAKDFGYDDDVMSQIQKKQSTLTFLLTGYCEVKNTPGYKVFDKLAAASNGQVYNLQTQDIADVLHDVKETLDKKRITLKFFDSPTAKSSSVDLTVDENLKEFSVSVAGHLPNITVLNPRNETYDKAKETINLENLKIVNVQNPEPGEWKVNTNADSGHSVRLTALSNVIFNFGFSLKTPQRIVDTSYNPLIGQDNILAISPSNRNLISNLTNVQIALFNEENPTKPFSFSLNLNKIPGENPDEVDEDIYMTPPFQPPRQPFKVYLNGFDEKGNPMQRLISTVIQSTEEFPPEIFIEEGIVHVGDYESFTLKCHVESLSPVTIEWKQRNQVLVQKNADQSSTLEYTVNSADGSHDGDYVCAATNNKGSAMEIATVKIQVPPLSVTIPSTEYFKLENQSAVEIQCFISLEKNFQQTWLFNDQPVQAGNEYELDGTHLIIKNLKRKHTGSYTCDVATKREHKATSTHLTVLYPAKILDPLFEEMNIIYGDTLNISCKSEGEPSVTTKWLFQPNYGSRQELSFTDTIVVPNFQPKSEGKYSCHVENDVGEQDRDVKVNGLSKAAPILHQPSVDQITINIKDRLQLICNCKEWCFPLQKYYWKFRNDEGSENILEDDEHIKVVLNTNENRDKFNFTLSLNNVTAANEGLFTCFVENNAGSDEIIISVTVKIAPKINDLILYDWNNKTGRNDVILEGSSGYIRCVVSGTPIPVVRWTKNGSDLLYDERVYLKNSSLALNNVKPSDGGIYSCQALNPFGVTTKNLTILVVEPKIVVAPTQQQGLITAVEGSKVRLPCALQSHIAPSLTWLLNGYELSVQNTKYLINNSSLEFYASGKDSGIYECRILDDDTYLQQESVLVIFTRPKLYSTNTDVVNITSNSDVILKCDATGFPIPNVTWSFEGDLLSDSSNAKIRPNGELLLTNLTIKNAGAYVCDAINSVGIAQKIFYIVINDPPQILSDLPTNLTVISGERFTVECKALGNPYPKLSWQLPSGQWISGGLLNISTEENKNSTGKYICLAENAHFLDVKEVFVDVIEKPTFKPEEAEIDNNILLGTTLTITCPFENFKTLKWFKNGELIKQDTKLIKLQSVAKEDRGNYSCTAENIAGQNEHTFEIVVRYSPEIHEYKNENDDHPDNLTEKNYTELIATVDNLFKIDCIVDGYPQPEIQWVHNANVISTNKTLSINYVSLEDKGVYKCIATNQHGTDERLFNLQVQYPPFSENGTKTDKYLEFNEEDEIKLNCSMNGYPKLSYFWSKNGESLPTENGDTLVIESAAFEDTGVYLCHVQNNIGSQEMRFHVQVYIPAKIEMISKDITVQNTEPLNISCTATGYPLPIVSLLYNNEVIGTTSRIHSLALQDLNGNKSGGALKYFLDQHGNGKSLRLFSNSHDKFRYAIAAYENDKTVELTVFYGENVNKPSGQVDCTTTNAVGFSEDFVAIEVIAKPTFVTKSHPAGTNDIKVLEGLPVILNCAAVGQPLPDIRWRKNQEAIDENDDNINFLNDKKYLNIIQARQQDTGIWECIAENTAGTNSLSFMVYVLVPPKIQLSNGNIDRTHETLRVNEGESLNITCPIIGHPELDFVWYQITVHQLTGEEVERIIQPENISEKKINSIINSTSYLCYASNKLGHTEYIFHILVDRPPKLINDSIDYQTVNLHLGFTLDCSASGEPEPLIAWFKDGEIIDVESNMHHNPSNKFLSTNQQILRIISSIRTDAGEYVCEAKNRLGVVKRVFNIEIYERVHLSPWTQWSSCSTSCGPGSRTRRRHCTHQNGSIAIVDDPNCDGIKEQVTYCEVVPCPINGDWGVWEPWSECSHTCIPQNSTIESRKVRYRKCDSPSPAFGGKLCIGADYEQKVCDVPMCPINGQWSHWTPWGECSSTCGNGIQTRYRKCNNPTPEHGGTQCIGPSSESSPCLNKLCPVDGGWSEWSEWSECTRTCGRGQRYRKRECNNPKPSFDGAFCIGPGLETVACKIKSCKSPKNVKDRYTPLVTYLDPGITLSGEYDEDGNDNDNDNRREDNEDNRVYSLRKPEEHVSPDQAHKTQHYDVARKVIVEVENFIPISEDTAHISVNLKGGMGPVTLSKPKCAADFEYNESNKKCQCRTGFVENKKTGKCDDINECTKNVHKCSHFCKNDYGSYNCYCPAGMMLMSNKHTCKERKLQTDIPKRT